MLKVSLHFATPATVSPENVLGRLDIGYARLDAKADYKAVLFTCGEGEHEPVQLYDYPRWSCSVWDLVARVVCRSLHQQEAIPKDDSESARKGAFIDDMTAIIEHWPDGLDMRRSTIGTAHIQMRRRRGNYLASFATDVAGDQHESSVFIHKPKQLKPWDLLARAYAWSVNERFELPPRPKLYIPIPMQDGEQSLVSLDTVSEPAFSGITKWMYKRGLGPLASQIVHGPCVTEAHFVQFLRSAV
jgi:hypothetical protein